MKTSPEIKAMSDGELLEYLCSFSDDEVAYDTFVKRYIEEMLSICEKVCYRQKLHVHIGRQIVTDTFEKVRKHKSYDKSKTNNLDERKAILGFLYTIALNLFRDYHKRNKKIEERSNSNFDNLREEVVDYSGLVYKKEIAAKLLKNLNSKEKKVLLTDIEYKKFYKYLPDNVVSDLSIELDVKPATIRKIRERAFLKLKKAIDEFNKEQ